MKSLPFFILSVVIKSLSFFILFVAPCISVSAQNDYKNAMIQNIQALDTTKDAQTLTSIAATFAAIYEFKKEWHPLYYECLTYINLSEAAQNIDKKKAALEKASELLKNLPQENDEVQVLQAWHAMYYLGVDRSAWQTYMPVITESLAKAENININNPRIYFLRGLLKYNMPAGMGGGHEEGMKLFQQSLEKFKSFRPADELAPSWGRKDVEKYLTAK